jgi:septum site-determining protein MinD
MIGVGLLGAFFIIRYDTSELKSFGPLLYLLSLGLLIAVLLFGTEVRGTTGWISLGPLPAIQPAEFTKIMLIVAFADFINRRRGELDTLSQILPCLAYMGIPFILIMMQPDLGTALVYIAITIIMLFIAGANPRILVALIVGAILLVGLVFLLHFHWGMPIPLEDYQLKRLTVFLDPYNDGQGGRGAGWNTIQSLVAIGSGGLAGKGLYNGSQVQLNFLPEHHTDFIYAVIGLRNLDVVMGLENRIVFDIVDAVNGHCKLKQALIKDKRFEGLYLLPAAQTKDKTAVSPHQMKNMVNELRKEFDFILVDCPAGIEQGFKNAIAGADKAVVVATPEVSSVRDADRIIGLLEAAGLTQTKLIINRIRSKMVKRGDMMDTGDIIDILAIDLLGVVPEDEAIVVSTNRGEPAVMENMSRAGAAYRRIARRLNGEDVPIYSLEDPENIMDKFKKILKLAR